MDPKLIKDWVLFAWLIIGVIFSMGVVWARLTSKMNGLGGRVKIVEEDSKTQGGRMDRMERELADYRRDVQDTNSRLGRVEKGVEDVNETVNQGNLSLGSQLHAIEKLIQEKDARIRERLVRVETVTQIEKKIGPISQD